MNDERRCDSLKNETVGRHNSSRLWNPVGWDELRSKNVEALFLPVV